MRFSLWLRASTRAGLGVALGMPILALPLAVLWDRGPRGETRVSAHLFPLALWLLDDFAWTCARNSLVFAVAVSTLSLLIGGILGWLVARRRFWGRGLWRTLLFALVAVAPAYLALGLVGLWGWPRPWPWPIAPAIASGVSLESWLGLPLWCLWIWTTLPWGVALVALATTSAVERLEPSWDDAARLSGAGALRAWHTLSWPLVRPSSCRAAALVFVFALAEPGAVVVLGLRRTLAFQIIDLVRRGEPFPAAAVWAVMTGVFGIVGWAVWRWLGGTSRLELRNSGPAGRCVRRSPAGGSLVAGTLLAVLVAGWAVVGWLPFLGLVRLAIDVPRAAAGAAEGRLAMIAGMVRHLSNPPVPAVLANSLLLGLEVVSATFFVGWMAGAGGGGKVVRRSRTIGARLFLVLECAPPSLQGAGLLAVAWLLLLAAAGLSDRGDWRALAIAVGSVSSTVAVSQNPWMLMSCGVILTLTPRFLRFWHDGGRGGEDGMPTESARQAALLAGASHSQAARLGRMAGRRRWIAGSVLLAALAATNLAPALLFESGPDGQTLGPLIVRLAVGQADDRSQAATLALCAIAINLAALGVARASGGLPHAFNPD
jgi:iron(III) transport system permease protein